MPQASLWLACGSCWSPIAEAGLDPTDRGAKSISARAGCRLLRGIRRPGTASQSDARTCRCQGRSCRRSWHDAAMTDPRTVDLPAEVLDDVARLVGAEVTLLSGLPGGVNGGAMRVELAGGASAVLKAVPREHPSHLDETLRAQRVVEHMRGRGYPTPAWLGVGATATHVWHLMDFVDAAPAAKLTPSLVEQLMEIVELQAGQASEPYDHWSYAWRVATGQESAVARLDVNETPEQSLLRQSVARLSCYSSVVSALVARLRLVCADVPPPRGAPDMVHADLSTPSNVLVRDGAVVAVVDIGNAGSGTRAIDLTTLVWYTFQDSLLDGARKRLWARILDLVGWEGAAVLTAAQILHMLEIPIRHGRHDVVPGVVTHGHRALDELNSFR
jgi:aminoglycoside phosphotransferase